MYGREYGDKTLNFEASGGLINASLVMQDKETDSYWSIMTGDALSGELEGTHLEELPVGLKTQWKDWVALHPDTKILSVEGEEHSDRNPYEEYFSNEDGFRGLTGADERLTTKTPIYSFQLGDTAYAVPHAAFVEGGSFDVGDQKIFLYRPDNVAVFYSTLAWISDGGFEQRDGTWHDVASGARFDAGDGFVGGDAGQAVERLDGFDTYWYNWSLIHPETEILGSAGP